MKLKVIGIMIFLCVCSCGLWGCSPPVPEENRWEESPYTEESFLSEDGIVMEMAYQGYGTEDRVISYTLANRGMEPISFDDTVGLEYFLEDTWRVVPLRSEASGGEERVLDSMQMCRVDVDLSLFACRVFPEGRYRVVRQVGDALLMAEYSLQTQRMDVSEMDFGLVPLTSLPAEYDTADAQNDGYYAIAEDAIYHQEKVQYFVDKVSLGVPAMLRTVMALEEGVLVRDILFDPSVNGVGRFSVVTGNFHAEMEPIQTPPPRMYSHMSIIKVDNKRKVCLSNYASYTENAPEGAENEVLSPGAADNIDLVATVELRTEENIQRLGHQLLVFGPEGMSYAALQLGENDFTIKSGEIDRVVSLPEDLAMALTTVGWQEDAQLILTGTTADGEGATRIYDIPTDTFIVE